MGYCWDDRKIPISRPNLGRDPENILGRDLYRVEAPNTISFLNFYTLKIIENRINVIYYRKTFFKYINL